MGHKKNNLLNNLGKADVTYHVNFKLLNEYFIKNDLDEFCYLIGIKSLVSEY